MDLERARIRLAVVLGEHRLGIEQVHLAGTAVLEKADHRSSSCLWLGTRLPTRSTRDCAAPRHPFSADLLLIEQMSKRQRPQAPGITAQEGAAIQRKKRWSMCPSWSSSSQFNQRKGRHCWQRASGRDPPRRHGGGRAWHPWRSAIAGLPGNAGRRFARPEPALG